MLLPVGCAALSAAYSWRANRPLGQSRINSLRPCRSGALGAGAGNKLFSLLSTSILTPFAVRELPLKVARLSRQVRGLSSRSDGGGLGLPLAVGLLGPPCLVGRLPGLRRSLFRADAAVGPGRWMAGPRLLSRPRGDEKGLDGLWRGLLWLRILLNLDPLVPPLIGVSFGASSAGPGWPRARTARWLGVEPPTARSGLR